MHAGIGDGKSVDALYRDNICRKMPADCMNMKLENYLDGSEHLDPLLVDLMWNRTQGTGKCNVNSFLLIFKSSSETMNKQT